jgi:hypothetical protein
MNIIWSIYNIKKITETGLVFKVIYEVKAKIGGLTEIYTGKVEFEGDPESENFIPFLELKKETVIQWVKEKLGEVEVNAIEEELITKLTQRLEEMRNKITSTGIPWEMNKLNK